MLGAGQALDAAGQTLRGRAGAGARAGAASSDEAYGVPLLDVQSHHTHFLRPGNVSLPIEYTVRSLATLHCFTTLLRSTSAVCPGHMSNVRAQMARYGLAWHGVGLSYHTPFHRRGTPT